MPMNGARCQPILARTFDEIEQELDELLDGILALRRVVAMPPELHAMDAGIGEVALLLRVKFDDAGANVAAADIDGQDAVVAGEDPRRHEVDAADEAGVVGCVANRAQLDSVPSGFQGDAGAADRELADAALTQAAAHDDALDVLPFLQAQEAADHGGELLRELFDRAVNHACRLRIAFQQDLVELLLAHLVAGLLAQRVLAHLADPLAPIVEDGLKRPLAGPVADEAIRRGAARRCTHPR